MKKKYQWKVVWAYDYGLSFKKGDLVSRHTTQELAEKKAKGNNWVKVQPIED